MQSTTFSVKLIKEDDSIRSQYEGDNAKEAYNCYNSAFRALLTVPGMKTIETTINNVPVTAYFDLILEDCYLS